jgi:6-phosphogluconolactonase (cycloisomerase 2 family)
VKRALLLILSSLVAWLAAPGQVQAQFGRFPFPGAVYTMSNAADGNRVLVFDRLLDGRLVAAGSASTRGLGSGTGLGNQGGVILTRSERFLLAVNAGSDSISVFEVRRRGLVLRDVEPSGGQQPVSVTEHHGVIYVLNAASDSIAGFRLRHDGRLLPIAGSTRSLSGAGTGPAQVEFTPDGEMLVVTEKATNNILTFAVDRHGVAGEARVHPSNGATPFGFAFGKRGHLLVSEAFGGAADASATSSYAIDDDGGLTTISASVGTTETAACWAAVTPNGRFAYVTNTGSGTISGYAVDFDGTLALLDADGRTGVTGDGSGPIDLVIADGGRFLYVLNAGTHTIGAFRISHDGSLHRLPFAGGLPDAANGLAVR